MFSTHFWDKYQACVRRGLNGLKPSFEISKKCYLNTAIKVILVKKIFWCSPSNLCSSVLDAVQFVICEK